MDTSDNSAGDPVRDPGVLLDVRDLRIHFRSEEGLVRAVDGVSFQLRPGETLGLVGESGCGKTVSSLAILKLLEVPPAEYRGGEIVFEGRDLLKTSEKEMRRLRGKVISMIFQEPMTSLNPILSIGSQVAEVLTGHQKMKATKARERTIELLGMVFQEPLTSLNPVLTIGEQIAEPLRIHTASGAAEIRAATVRLLQDVGIDRPAERLNDYPHQLSGGQRQRVMIAMALACGPDLLIADEPTTALDVTIQAQILKLLTQLQAARDMAVLYITHDLGVVSQIADRVYVMYAGLIVEHGPVAAILREPRHPYTQALLASLPHRRKRGTRLHSIPGAVPHPAHKPPGCPFHPRCARAVAVCRIEFPDLCLFSDSHAARCPVAAGRWS